MRWEVLALGKDLSWVSGWIKTEEGDLIYAEDFDLRVIDSWFYLEWDLKLILVFFLCSWYSLSGWSNSLGCFLSKLASYCFHYSRCISSLIFSALFSIIFLFSFARCCLSLVLFWILITYSCFFYSTFFLDKTNKYLQKSIMASLACIWVIF